VVDVGNGFSLFQMAGKGRVDILSRYDALKREVFFWKWAKRIAFAGMIFGLYYHNEIMQFLRN